MMTPDTFASRKRVNDFKSDIVEHWAKIPELTNVEYQTALADLLNDSLSRSLSNERAKAYKKAQKKRSK